MATEDEIEALIPNLRRFARSLCRDVHLADDLVQDTLERALSRLFQWRRGTNLRAWLFTIMRNLYLNGRKRRYAPAVTLEPEQWESRLVQLPEQVDRTVAMDLIRAMEALPDEQREVILLVGLEGFKYEEAAGMLGIPKGTVMSRLFRGREELRRRLTRGERPSLREVSPNEG